MKFYTKYNLPAINKSITGKIISMILLAVLLNIVVVHGQKKSPASSRVSKTQPFHRSGSVSKIKTYTVSGIVTQTFSYCGGAAPPKQLLDQLATPVAYTGKKFYIRKGKINSTASEIVKKIMTGPDGKFSFSLAPGTYSVILEEQLNKLNAADFISKEQQVDEKCLEEWWVKPYCLLEVRNKNIAFNFNFHHRCFVSGDIPCINYLGPLPL